MPLLCVETCLLEVQLPGQQGKLPIKNDQHSAALAASQVERIGKVHTLPVPLKG